MESPKVAAWVAEYQGEFGEFPGTGALLGRAAAEQLVELERLANERLNVDLHAPFRC